MVVSLALVGIWTILTALHVPGEVAFAWAFVGAGALLVWLNMPEVVRRRRWPSGTPRRAVTGATIVQLTVMGLMVWSASPELCHRVLSCFAGLYAAVMVAGVLGDNSIADRFAPGQASAATGPAFRRRALVLNGAMAGLVIVINEALLAAEPALGSRVAVLALTPLALHYLYWALAGRWLAHPDDEGR